MNQKNKLQIVNILLDYINSGCIKNKAVIVNKGSECFFIDHGNNCTRISELDSSHREADQKIPMHAVYAGQQNNDTVCVVARIQISTLAWSVYHISFHQIFIFIKAKQRTKMG